MWSDVKFKDFMIRLFVVVYGIMSIPVLLRYPSGFAWWALAGFIGGGAMEFLGLWLSNLTFGQVALALRMGSNVPPGPVRPNKNRGVIIGGGLALLLFLFFLILFLLSPQTFP